MDSDGAASLAKRLIKIVRRQGSGFAARPVATMRRAATWLLLAGQVFFIPVYGQGRGGRGGAGRGQPPRAAAAFDPTGYWVSVVTEDWMFRMVTPPKGQYLG